MEKTCTKCGQTKPSEEFYHVHGRPMGKCKKCFRKYQAVMKMRPPRIKTPPGTKRCALCKQIKPEAEFWADRTYHDGRMRSCKTCMYAKTSEWHRTHKDHLANWRKNRYRSDPERFADNELKKRLDLPPGTYQDMLNAQHGKCAICFTQDPGTRTKRFSVDHCHDTGQVRGLLCGKCNRGIGYLQHSESILSSAIKYISQKHQYSTQ